MSERTHYDTLGVRQDATASEIKSAYRRIVLEHHPDRSKATGSVEVFRQATDAYDVISDSERRRTYDEALERVRVYREERARPKRPDPPRSHVRVETPTSTEDVQRLARLFAQGRVAQAEDLANLIRKRDPRQPLPYAVLGDLARSRGDLARAAQMYAYAVQFEPGNSVYQRRYEQFLASSSVTTSTRSDVKLEAPPTLIAAPAVGGVVTILGAAFVAFNREKPEFAQIPAISSWSLGLVVCLLLLGITLGSVLSIGNWVDRFAAVSTTAAGRISPSLVLGLVALVSFWAALAIYLGVGFAQRGFNYSSSRLIAGTVGIVLLVTLAAGLSSVTQPMQVLLWSGNLVYVGALIGWLTADAFKGIPT